MPTFGSKLGIAQRIILAIDTSNADEAENLAQLAKSAGARFIKFGLQIATAKSWQWCAELSKKYGLEWVADAKLADIPNTIEASVASLVELGYSPYAITIHATAGHQAMVKAQASAGQVLIFGVTILTSLSDEECHRIYGSSAKDKVMELAQSAAAAGIAGIVASPKEVGMIKQNEVTKSLLTMIPGSRSTEAQAADQARVATPSQTITAGADLLVIGREITHAKDPAVAFAKIVNDIKEAVNEL
ncbi:MAG: Orotidine 5'-phosphate decarboxylase [Candidatus Saccharibacteria bacterium GW2011_GWA2_46_10]|nr:MAG: Orotidine 5'-phosphate decarboxylase [Candidatus Saccharibacteria bacterium GW2011_GWA2_46_10]OGL35582.1 MAG: orotidine 5'-phosphate decarboxylase [Candidatus Saccharibacteria bacterium RIFCSPHIGHO2_12_FULL_47_17]